MMNHVLLPEPNATEPGEPTPFNVPQLADYENIRQRFETLFQQNIPASMMAEALTERPTISDVVHQEIGSGQLSHNSDFMQRVSQRYMQKMAEQARLK